MQGNTTEIDERNLLRLDALLSHGYGLSPQLVMRSKGLSIEAKALYSYLSSFAGAGDTAFPSTSRILEELDISKNRFYKIRKELISWGFISIETTATSGRSFAVARQRCRRGFQGEETHCPRKTPRPRRPVRYPREAGVQAGKCPEDISGDVRKPDRKLPAYRG